MRRRHRTGLRVLAAALTVPLCVSVAGLAPAVAHAAGTVLFQNNFNDRTVDGTGTVTVPTPVSGTNVACLTAKGNSSTPPLFSCSGNVDNQGSGKLRLTDVVGGQVGGVFGQTSFPTSNGLDVTFNSYQWGGTSADGIAFMLAAVDPANPVPPTSIGSSGGALGYSAAPGFNGLTNAYLGVGLDVFGNFSSSSYSGTGCPGSIPGFGVAAAGAVAVRGPGNVRVGYCGLTSTYNGTQASKLTLHASTRAASAVPVEVLINPTTTSFTSGSGASVAAGTYKVVVTPIGQSTRTLSGTLPTVASGLYPSSTWLNADGVPKQLAFGFVGSTGSVTDTHEISNVNAVTFNPVPQLGVASTAYSVSSPHQGDPVTYVVTGSVLSGADETSPISVTQTVPTGVVPVAAYGTGWVCATPVGQSVTCTTSASSFTNGTTLPTVTVTGIVTGTSVTSALIQSGSSARASSTDADPGSITSATAGTVPGAPSGVSISPAVGPIADGALTTVTASTSVAPTAIEIGTTAEQQAGTSLVVPPCTAGRAVGCFNVEGSTYVFASMPARAGAATVTVTVVTLGIAGSTTYVYADKPAAPAAPTATAGVSGATVTWTAPAANGSAITGYVVTPFLAGVAKTPLSFDTSTTTRTLTGLTPGGAYTFTVAAVNAFGTSTASAASAAVVPYAVPGAPTVTAVSAGSLAATLTWTAPASNGSAITGYVVTPFIGAVAQTGQTFGTSATTQVVTGLTAGVTYTFTVAAQNLAGTGPASANSSAVIPNQSPSLTFSAPPTGEVGLTYSRQLTVSDGTSPFVWSISSGTLPIGLTLNASTGLLAGTPTAAGSSTFVVQVADASGLTATRAVTVVVAAVPVLTFTPAAGEVSLAYSQQPTLTGGTGPFTWAVSAGSLPAGITLNPTTGLVSGTPTAAGTFSLTIAVTDALNQVVTRTVTLVVAALPTFAPAAPPSGQVGVAYSNAFTVTGGALPLVWSISAGSLPAGLTFNTATGLLSGTATTVGSSPFTVSVVDANGQKATKAVTLVITAGPLVITKTANVSSAVLGSVVAYTITVVNTGSTAFTGVSLSDPLTDVLDDAGYNADATATSGTVTYSAPTLGWTGNVGALSTVTISYSVTVRNPDTGNKVLSNSVTSTSSATNCAAGSTDARCSVTVTVPGLTIVQTTDVASTTPGGVVHVTVVITNTGQTAYPSATFTDGLAGMLDDATYDVDGTATSGNVSYSSPGLTWAGPLGVGATATVTFSVTVNNPDTGDRSLIGIVVSPSAGSPCPAGSPAAPCTATTTVLVPALSITAGASVGTTTPGGSVAYTVILADTGQTAYSATSVTVALGAVLDDATYGDNAAASSGSVAFNTGTSTLVWTGALGVGAIATVTFSVTVRSPDTGDRTLTAATTSAAPGSTCPGGGPNPACTSIVQVLLPALAISTSADVATTTPGSVVHYTVSVVNTGQTPYSSATFSQALSGVLDDAGYDNDATTTAGSVFFSAPTLTWTGALAIGATATITYSVRVANPDNGDRTLTATAVSAAPGSTCPPGGSDPHCTTSVQVLVPAVAFTFTSDVTGATTPGSVVHYTVTATNTGQTTYTNLAVTLDLTGALDDATYAYDATITTGSLVLNPDGTTSWVLGLAPGASATGKVSFTVHDPDTGDRSLHVLVVSDAPGSTCPTGSADTACANTLTVLVPGLVITKTASTSTVSPGGSVGYTVSVVNTGQTVYPAASVRDDLSKVLTDASYDGDAVATTGTVGYGAPVLSWTGTLAPGASATITYSVTVLDPDPGDKRLINTVTSTSAGNNCATGSGDARCTSVVSVLVPGLTIAATAGANTAVPGATVRYTVTVTNSGATAFSAANVTESLTGVLDDATYDGDAAAGVGTITVSGSTLAWSGALAIGASTTITYSVTVHTADGGNNLVTATWTSTTPGNNCASGNTDTRCSVTVPVSRLVIEQHYVETSTTPGSVVHVIATLTNAGQVPYVDANIATPTAGIVDDGTPNGDFQTASSGTLSLAATGFVWTGDIPIGGIVTITGSLTVDNPDLGDRVIHDTVVSTTPGSNCPAGGTDARCSASVQVLLPGLSITKTANVTAVAPGGSVVYTLTVHNTGQTPYVGASVTDSLADVLGKGTYDGDATASVGTVTYTAPTLSWTGDLAVGASATITYSVAVSNESTADKTIVNAVTSNAVGSSCPLTEVGAACESVVAILTPELTIDKTADLANATLGSTVTYTVQVTDTGQTSYPAAAFTDSLAALLDDATYNADATATVGTVGYSAGVLTWAGALDPGGSAVVTYSVQINSSASEDRTLVNTVSSSNPGSDCPPGAMDPRCSATVAETNETSLTFTKTADVAATQAGGVVRYTLTVTNATQSTVASADVTDPLADIIDDATYNGDASATAGTVGYTAPDLTWTGDVPALGTITITYSVTVHTTVTGDQNLTDTVSSTSLPASDNCVSASGDPRCTTSIPVAGLLIQQAYTASSTTPGATVHLTATFTNTGQMPYTGITVASPVGDTFDDAVPVGDQSATSGTLSIGATTIDWSGDIPVGGIVTITGTLTVQSPDPGNRLLTGTLVSSAIGNNCPPDGTDGRCTASLPVLLPGLTITKVADSTSVQPGSVADYTITVHDTGQTPYVGAVVTDDMTGVLDDAAYDADAATDIGVVSFAGSTLTWTGDLAVGATATINYSVTVNSSAGDKTMVNSVSSADAGSTCTPGTGGTACTTVVGVLTPVLAITSAASAATTTPGAAVIYTVTATNVGQLSYGAANLSVPLAGVLDDATYGGDASASAGTVAAVDQTLTWTGPLAIGAAVTITYSVTVNQPDTGDFRLAQTVTSTSPGTNCSTTGADSACTTSVPVASLRILNSSDVTALQPGSVVRDTVVFTNLGQVPYVGLGITDSFVGSLDDAAYNGDATTTAGDLRLDPDTGTVTWSGDLPVGATVTVTGTLTVHSPDSGDRDLTTLVSTDASASDCPAVGPSPSCATSVPVLIPGLIISKSASTSTAIPGSTVGYTIIVRDSGQTAYTGATVTDALNGVLTDATYGDDATATAGTVGLVGTTLTWTGDLAIGQTATITYSVRINSPDLGDRILHNDVSSATPGSTCPADATDPACVTTVFVLVPGLDIAVTSDVTTALPGGTVGYTVTVANSGQTPYVGASVTAGLARVLDDAVYDGDATRHCRHGRVRSPEPDLDRGSGRRCHSGDHLHGHGHRSGHRRPVAGHLGHIRGTGQHMW